MKKRRKTLSSWILTHRILILDRLLDSRLAFFGRGRLLKGACRWCIGVSRATEMADEKRLACALAIESQQRTARPPIQLFNQPPKTQHAAEPFGLSITTQLFTARVVFIQKRLELVRAKPSRASAGDVPFYPP